MLSASPTMLENLKDARRFFERGMVREAAQKADAADIEELDRLVEEQAAVVGDVEAFVAADRRFHGKIAAISRNAIFDAVAEAMLGWLHDHTRSSPARRSPNGAGARRAPPIVQAHQGPRHRRRRGGVSALPPSVGRLGRPVAPAS